MYDPLSSERISRISEIVVPGQPITHTVPQCKLQYLYGASNIVIFQMHSSTCPIMQLSCLFSTAATPLH